MIDLLHHDSDQLGDSAPDTGSTTELALNGHRLTRSLFAVSFVLLFLSATTRSTGLNVGRLDVDHEASLPTLWSVLLIASLTGLLAIQTVVARRQPAERSARWLLVTMCVGYVMIDESLSIHETAIDPVRNAFDTGGLLYLAWIIPFGLLALAIVGFLTPWLLSLERNLRMGLVIAGIVYFAGAVGMEGVGGVLLDNGALLKSDAFTVATTIEEGLEMSGIILAIRTVWANLTKAGPMSIRLTS